MTRILSRSKLCSLHLLWSPSSEAFLESLKFGTRCRTAHRLLSSSSHDDQKTSGNERRQLLMIDGQAIGTTESSVAARDSAKTGRQLHMDGPTASSDPHGAEESERQDSRDQAGSLSLLNAALLHVKELGWTVEAVRRGAQDLGLSPSAASQFERPEAALVAHFVGQCNSELVRKLEAHRAEVAGMQVGDRVRTAIQWRLQMLIPHMSNWSQALAIHSSPGSLPTALKQLARMSDDIWHAAGDTSADFNWYTKRAAVAGVYTATQAYMLTDYSPGYADTWDALDRRLQDVAALGKWSGKAKQASKQATDSLDSVLKWAQQQFRGQAV